MASSFVSRGFSTAEGVGAAAIGGAAEVPAGTGTGADSAGTLGAVVVFTAPVALCAGDVFEAIALTCPEVGDCA